MARAKYPLPKENTVRGEVVELLIDPARTSVLAEVILEDQTRVHLVAPEGSHVGQQIQIGKEGEVNVGNVLPLSVLAEGTPIFNIEATPGDGGQFARASGGYALIVTKNAGKVLVKLSSGKVREFNPDCRATIGIAAAGGRTEKPFIKAGARYHLMHAKGQKYPRVRGVAMNALDHPFGGSQHHPGKSKSTARGAPPGRKVGAIASSRTGRRKKN
ncbi:MAG: 50S ribosomal protein L2 [Candidatus Diapherotrites archaeon]|nr:50S ribosomal protein L2 [Candidatus Diapherotrites archaeon]